MDTKRFNPLEYGAVPVGSTFDPVALGAVKVAEPEQERPGLFSVNTLKGETTYPAAEGGAGDIPGNVVRTFGNIPSSAAKIVRATAAPVNPLDTGSSVNIGKNLVGSALTLRDIFKNRGLKAGASDIAGGFVDTAKKGFDMYKALGESIYSNLERNVESEGSISKGVGVSAGQATSEVAKIGIEDPLLIPTLLYGGPKALEGGGTTDTISQIARPFTGGADTSLSAVYNKAVKTLGVTRAARVENAISAREREIFDIENNYAKTRNAMDYSKDANAASRRRIASTDVLVGSVDDTGKLRTTQPGGAADKYRALTIDNTEGVVRNGLVREGATVAPDVVRNQLRREIMSSGLEGKALKSALNGVDSEVEGLALRAGPDGKIPLEYVHDAKIATTNGVNYFTEPFVKAERKAIARAYKTIVEKTSNLNVGEINAELSKYLQDLDLIESLDGKLVMGGKLGKYFAATGGTLVGGALGAAIGGPYGSAIGAAIGGEVAAKLKGAAMSRTLGKAYGLVPEKSAVLEKAVAESKAPRLALPAPKATESTPMFVTPGGKASSVAQEASDMAAVEKGAAKTTPGKIRKVLVPGEPYVPDSQLPVIQTGPKPKTPGVDINKLGAPNVYGPEAKAGVGGTKITMTTGSAKPLVPKTKLVPAERYEQINHGKPMGESTFFSKPRGGAEGEFGNIKIEKMIDTSKLYKGVSSEEYAMKAGLMNKPMPPELQKLTGFKTLKQVQDYYVNDPTPGFQASKAYQQNPNIYYSAFQQMAAKDLKAKGFAGANWSHEDDLVPFQYQIWDKSVLKDK